MLWKPPACCQAVVWTQDLSLGHRGLEHSLETPRLDHCFMAGVEGTHKGLGKCSGFIWLLSEALWQVSQSLKTRLFCYLGCEGWQFTWASWS